VLNPYLPQSPPPVPDLSVRRNFFPSHFPESTKIGLRGIRPLFHVTRQRSWGGPSSGQPPLLLFFSLFFFRCRPARLRGAHAHPKKEGRSNFFFPKKEKKKLLNCPMCPQFASFFSLPPFSFFFPIVVYCAACIFLPDFSSLVPGVFALFFFKILSRQLTPEVKSSGRNRQAKKRRYKQKKIKFEKMQKPPRHEPGA